MTAATDSTVTVECSCCGSKLGKVFILVVTHTKDPSDKTYKRYCHNGCLHKQCVDSMDFLANRDHPNKLLVPTLP